jgi:hypothetical protein
MSDTEAATIWKLSEPYNTPGIPTLVQLDVVHTTPATIVVRDQVDGHRTRRYAEHGLVTILNGATAIRAGKVVRPYAYGMTYYGATQELVLQDWWLRLVTHRDNLQAQLALNTQQMNMARQLIAGAGYPHLVDNG